MRNPAFRALPLLLLVMTAFPVSTSFAESSDKTIKWTYNNKPRSVSVAAAEEGNIGWVLNVAGAYYYQKIWEEMQGKGFQSGNKALLSAVGPMVSYYITYEGYYGGGGWVSEYVQTEFLDGYFFSMYDYLNKLGRLKKEYQAREINNFWIIAWSGDKLTLGIQLAGVDVERSSNQMVWEEITIPPPKEWLPWLQAAAQGQGLLKSNIVAPPAK